jgi:hypothetical protein
VKIVAEVMTQAEEVKSLTSVTPLEITPSSYIPLSKLFPIFIRLDNQASQLGEWRERRLLSPIFDDKERGYQAEIPYSFSSIEKARNSLAYV